MSLPPVPILVGSGVIVVTLGGIAGFILATKTRLTARQLAAAVGGGTAIIAAGIVLSPLIRRAVNAIAYGILIGFPLYALFWTLHDFVNRVVRS